MTTIMPPPDDSLQLSHQIHKIHQIHSTHPSFNYTVHTWQDPQPYLQTYQAMQDFTQQRKTQPQRDAFWVLTHQPIYTLGQAGLESHLLKASDIPVLKTDRGGQITYHGPGQLMVYCLLDLKAAQIHVRQLVRAMESAIIEVLAHFEILGVRHPGAPGIYVQQPDHLDHSSSNLEHLQKIAALGLKITQGFSYHGLALNIAPDLKAFNNINPCGYANLQTTDMLKHSTHPLLSKALDIHQISPNSCMHQVATALTNALAKHIYEAKYTVSEV